MDKISVTDGALQNVHVVLQQLSDSSELITGKCVSAITSQLSNLDSGIRKDVQGHLDEITKLKDKLKYCIDENKNAISDRLSKLPDYEHQVYKKRTIY